jgi:CheY-like chemotaxis protein
MKSVLYAEDSADDAFFMERALKQQGCGARLYVVSNGAEAISYLAGENSYQDRQANPLPNVVLLDLSMPVKNGFDVLKWIRSRPELKELPVYMLTSSSYEADRHRARALGANGYLVKPGQPDGLADLLRPWKHLL